MNIICVDTFYILQYEENILIRHFYRYFQPLLIFVIFCKVDFKIQEARKIIKY